MTAGRSGGVFISYRREDAAPYARLLHDELRKRFSQAHVFMDVESIEPGSDFTVSIQEAVGSSAVLLALIGRQWLTLTDEEGQRRLDDPDDYIRLEIQTALERGVRVIPVLVDNARALRPQQLPESLAKLARLNAAELSYSRYQHDADRLLTAIGRVLPPTSSTPTTSAESNEEHLLAGLDNEPRAGRHIDVSEVLLEPDPAEVTSSIRAKAADHAVGDVINGRFRILAALGKGGFSKVYRVLDELEDEERAVKLFDNAAGYQAVRRDLGELRKIDHPNVVKVYWADKTDDGDWYLVTEYIDGESLDEYTRGIRHLRDREAVDVVLDVLDALIAIHPDSARLGELDRKKHEGELSEAEYQEWLELPNKGLVHRDIKPRNVMLTRTGAKLLDFNIASRVGHLMYTQSGTPRYQPPGVDLTPWDVSTDLFAVGVMLYELLCNGQYPYPDGIPRVSEEVIDPKVIRSDLADPLVRFLRKACASQRAERFSTAAEMAAELRTVRGRL